MYMHALVSTLISNEVPSSYILICVVGICCETVVVITVFCYILNDG